MLVVWFHYLCHVFSGSPKLDGLSDFFRCRSYKHIHSLYIEQCESSLMAMEICMWKLMDNAVKIKRQLCVFKISTPSHGCCFAETVDMQYRAPT